MIEDAKDEYNNQYYKNWELFMGSIILMGVSIKLLKNYNAAIK